MGSPALGCWPLTAPRAHVPLSLEVAIRRFGNLTIIILGRPPYKDRALPCIPQRLSFLSTSALEKRQSRVQEHQFIHRLGHWPLLVRFVRVTDRVSDEAETRTPISHFPP